MILGNGEHKKYFGEAGERFDFHCDFGWNQGHNDAILFMH